MCYTLLSIILYADINAIHLGGKLLHQVTYTEESVQTMRSQGLDVQASVEGSYGPANVAVSAGANSESEGATARASSDADVRSYVFGGVPPAMDLREPAAFGAWVSVINTSIYIKQTYSDFIGGYCSRFAYAC